MSTGQQIRAPEGDSAVERRVLIAAEHQGDLGVLDSTLRQAGIETTRCATLAELCAALEQGAAAAIVAQEMLLSDLGPRLGAALSQQPEWSDFPLIVMAVPGGGRNGHTSLAPWLDHAGVNAVLLERPVRTITLLTSVRSAVRSRMRQYQVREELQRRRQAERALLEANQRKDNFLATLAHELRNPLAPIQSGLDLAEQLSEDPRLLKIFGSMQRQAKLLVALVNDLLDISRITRGKFALRRSHVKVADLVRGALESAGPLIERGGHALKVSQPNSQLYVNADPHRMTQILSNLLSNAAKYTPDGGKIELQVDAEGRDLIVSVRDSGIGIPSGMRTSIFEMFTQIENRLHDSSEGLGIGLTLVKSLVERHGGSIEAFSEGEGQGSEFIVRAPIIVEEGQASDSADTQVDGPGGALRILVADDNEAAAEMLGMLLTAQGHGVRIAHDGAEAVEIASRFQPDFVLLDIGMPNMDGLEAARRIRSEPWGKSMRIAALTGWGKDSDRKQTEMAGFDHHLVKPLRFEDLQQLLAEHARGS